MTHDSPRSVGPSQAAGWLLTAALSRERNLASEAWEKWKSITPFELIDYSSRQLIPLLTHNLRSLGIEDPLFGRYKGLWRRSWYENQILQHRTAAVVRQLAGKGIPTLLLKGAALAYSVYPDAGARPMSDSDILVPYARAQEAIELLYGCGWKSLFGVTYKATVANISERHSVDLVSPEGVEVDLHWHVLKSASGPTDDESFWQSAVATSILGVPTFRLCAEDCFLHVCEHGVPWNRDTPSIRWVADAALILRKYSDTFNWERVIEQSIRVRTTTLLAHACRYLDTNGFAAIPPSVLEALASWPVEKWETGEFNARTTPSIAGECRYQFWYHFVRRRMMTDPSKRSPRWRAYPRYLCGLLQCSGPLEIPIFIGRRSAEITLNLYRQRRERRRWAKL